MFPLLALGAVWLALAALGIALTMLLHRPAMTDVAILLVLWLGSPLSMCFAGLVLWAYRHHELPEDAVLAQRLQAKVAIAMAVFAAAVVYLLIIFSRKSEPVAAPPW
ncbi:MAG: hypothetical protein AABZ12_14185 [Planctomycetota bacterium]